MVPEARGVKVEEVCGRKGRKRKRKGIRQARVNSG